ncbi:MAG: hypothetical protein LUD78_08130 [Clostridiales bacterium]|nr:hypothetical protein [Clostridiales bacterium]
MELATLTELVKSRLNITWEDDITTAKVTNALTDALPSLCAKVGLAYDYDADEAASAVTEQSGTAVDITAPSQLRHLLVTYAAYIFDQQGHLFDANYRTEINACRQRYEVRAIEAEESEDDETEEDTDDGTDTG